MKITFLGAGVFGTALSNVAKYNGHEVKLYDPIKYPKTTLSSAISGADLVVYAAPSEKIDEILPQLDQDTPLICASKGFLSAKPFARFKKFSVLSGAAFAHDIENILNPSRADSQTTIIKNIVLTATSDLSEQIFSTENITIEYTDDIIGVLLCGALKNIYAIGAGIYGGDEVSRTYLENVITEMITILQNNHAKKETLLLSCGATDLVLTCSPRSRNFSFGRALKSQDKSLLHEFVSKNTIEGLSLIKSIDKFSDFVIPDSATILVDIIKVVKDAKEDL